MTDIILVSKIMVTIVMVNSLPVGVIRSLLAVKWCSKLLLWFLVHSEMFSIHINHGVVQAKMRLSLLFVSDCKSTPNWASDHFS